MKSFAFEKRITYKYHIVAFPNKNLINFSHWHNDIEVVFVSEGSIEVGLNNELLLLNKGDVCVFGSCDIHSFNSVGDSLMHSLLFPTNLIDIPLVTNSVLYHLEPKQQETLLNYFTKLAYISPAHPTDPDWVLSDLAMMNDESKIMSVSLTLQIMTMFFEIEPVRIFENSLQSNNIAKEILLYLEKNYNKDITLSEIAKHFSYNESHFSKMFYSLFHMNFKKYIINLRINEASILLTETDRSIIDICCTLGYNNLRNFNRNFQTVKGVTPSEYRKNNVLWKPASTNTLSDIELFNEFNEN